MVYAQKRIYPKNEIQKILLDFKIPTDYPYQQDDQT